jgi:hypothetical protein
MFYRDNSGNPGEPQSPYLDNGFLAEMNGTDRRVLTQMSIQLQVNTATPKWILKAFLPKCYFFKTSLFGHCILHSQLCKTISNKVFKTKIIMDLDFLLGKNVTALSFE